MSTKGNNKPPPQPKTPTTPPTQQTNANKRGGGSAKKDSPSPAKKKAKRGQPQPSPNTGEGEHKNKKEESGSCSEPRRITIVVSSNDDPKFSQDDARCVIKLASYLHDINGEHSTSETRIKSAIEEAARAVFSFTVKKQVKWGAFVRAVLSERAGSESDFLKQYLRKMSNPERRAIRYESDVESLWTAINKTVDTYAWLAGLCNVGMHPAEDIKIDMLYGSVPYEIGRTARIVANRSQDPVLVKNAIKVSLESADDVGSWLIGARGGSTHPIYEPRAGGVSSGYEQHSHNRDCPIGSDYDHRPPSVQGEVCFNCQQAGHIAYNCPFAVSIEEQNAPPAPQWPLGSWQWNSQQASQQQPEALGAWEYSTQEEPAQFHTPQAAYAYQNSDSASASAFQPQPLHSDRADKAPMQRVIFTPAVHTPQSGARLH